MKILVCLLAVCIFSCTPDDNVSKSSRKFVIDDDGSVLEVKEIDLDGRSYYISRGQKGVWVLGPQMK